MFLEGFSTASSWKLCNGMKRQLQRQDEREKHWEGGNGQMMLLLPSDSECVNVWREWDKVVPACTPPWICCCRPSDPFPGKWTRPMLSATDASTKTPFPSPPPPPSPSSSKVSELAKEGIEFQQFSSLLTTFFQPAQSRSMPLFGGRVIVCLQGVLIAKEEGVWSRWPHLFSLSSHVWERGTG